MRSVLGRTRRRCDGDLMAAAAAVVVVRLVGLAVRCELYGDEQFIAYAGADDAFTVEVLQPLRSWAWAHRAPQLVRVDLQVNGRAQSMHRVA